MKTFVLIHLGVAIAFGVVAVAAQTLIDSGSQVSPRAAVVVGRYSTCSTTPANPAQNCNGLGYIELKMSDGTLQKLFTIPIDPPTFTPDSNWTSIPVVLPPGPTAVPCSQTKP